MKVTLEVPDKTKAIVVTTIFEDSQGYLTMKTTNVTTDELKDGTIVNAMPEAGDDDYHKYKTEDHYDY